MLQQTTVGAVRPGKTASGTLPGRADPGARPGKRTFSPRGRASGTTRGRVISAARRQWFWLTAGDFPRIAGPPVSARVRGVHRVGRRVPGVRAPRPGRGSQRHARPLASLCDSGPRGERDPSEGGPAPCLDRAPEAPSGRRDGGAHGPGPADLPARPAQLLRLPGRVGLRGAPARESRAVSAPPPAAEDVGRLRRRGPRRPRGSRSLVQRPGRLLRRRLRRFPSGRPRTSAGA